jgi:hypothetical protein
MTLLFWTLFWIFSILGLLAVLVMLLSVLASWVLNEAVKKRVLIDEDPEPY